MHDGLMVYSIIYALAANEGREAALFGSCAQLANQAFARSVVGEAFPEIWFELPLAGDPWFDLHVLTSRETLTSDTMRADGTTVFHKNLFKWFANQQKSVRQLALSHDLSSGCLDNPAVQLLVYSRDDDVTCGFLEEAGRADAQAAYRAFLKRLPEGWFACYTGVFPRRPELNLRVECIPEHELQQAYAHDAALLEAHLRQMGLVHFGDTIIPRCQQLASMPFQFEFQFDVTGSGKAGPTLGASVRFAIPPGTEDMQPFEANGAAGKLMSLVESWGLADQRWRLFEDATFAKNVTRDGKSCTIFNYPAFVKLRWRQGKPLDAKAYFMAGVDTGA